MRMTQTHSVSGSAVTVRLAGELDSHAARDSLLYIGSVIDLCLPRTLTLDLRGLSFMDSSGLAVVMGAYRRMRELDGTLRVCNVPAQPMKVFAAVRLDRLIRFE